MERPILFSTPMVQAILAGSKTQTRRIAKGDVLDFLNDGCISDYVKGLCPYGQIGDTLWVRETWGIKYFSNSRPDSFKMEDIVYRASLTKEFEFNGNTAYFLYDKKWKPSIFMPKKACRIKLEIINIRVEKLCDITEEDAIAEGIEKKEGIYYHVKGGINPEPSDIYAELWDEINGTGSWIKNPWVWVISFKKL